MLKSHSEHIAGREMEYTVPYTAFSLLSIISDNELIFMYFVSPPIYRHGGDSASLLWVCFE